jgi:hypothetical protein
MITTFQGFSSVSKLRAELWQGVPWDAIIEISGRLKNAEKPGENMTYPLVN